jgi:ATP-dependent DNA helicase DinG
MTRYSLPFAFSKNESFYDKLNQWVGDVLYDILPEKGFELRDEQVYMAYQLGRAFKEKKVIFAEAGVGTGKTIVYLLYAICYARYTGKPAIIACADESLIEQLVKKEGDIAKLSKHLNLTIDVRLAKSHDQYLCLEKLDQAMTHLDVQEIEKVYEMVPEFVFEQGAMQSFYHYGDRKQYPFLSDDIWKEISWDPFQDCFSCEKRHRCGLTLSRDYYRKASDLIICSQDFYMEHVWTMEARKREGQLPLLPEHCCVVFDEGHLLEFAAQKALTYRLKESTLEYLLSRLLKNDIREEFALLVERVLEYNSKFFDMLNSKATKVQGSNRMTLLLDESFKRCAADFHDLLVEVGEALVFESELYTIDHYELNIIDEYIDRVEYAIRLVIQQQDPIVWLEKGENDQTFVVMPRAVEDVLQEKVFSKKIPYIFSSATLSDRKSFDYLASSLGIKDYLSFSVDSPFDYEEQMELYMPKFENDEHLFANKFDYTLKQIEKTEGGALILFNSKEDLQKFKIEVQKRNTKYPFLFQGDREISELVSRFQNEEETILCAETLWEGLDVPGPALSNVVIWSLPFPPDDPVFQAKRKTAENPYWQVDMPYMILRLRQGVGRLIRSRNDRGIVTIFVTNDLQPEVIEAVKEAMPIAAKIEG